MSSARSFGWCWWLLARGGFSLPPAACAHPVPLTAFVSFPVSRVWGTVPPTCSPTRPLPPPCLQPPSFPVLPRSSAVPVPAQHPGLRPAEEAVAPSERAGAPGRCLSGRGAGAAPSGRFGGGRSRGFTRSERGAALLVSGEESRRGRGRAPVRGMARGSPEEMVPNRWVMPPPAAARCSWAGQRAGAGGPQVVFAQVLTHHSGQRVYSPDFGGKAEQGSVSKPRYPPHGSLAALQAQIARK